LEVGNSTPFSLLASGCVKEVFDSNKNSEHKLAIQR